MPELEEDIPLTDSDDEDNLNETKKTSSTNTISKELFKSNGHICTNCIEASTSKGGAGMIGGGEDDDLENSENTSIATNIVTKISTTNSSDKAGTSSTSAAAAVPTKKNKRFNKENYAHNNNNKVEDYNDDDYYDEDDYNYSSMSKQSQPRLTLKRRQAKLILKLKPILTIRMTTISSKFKFFYSKFFLCFK